jgi:hypothetical protein
MGIALEGGISNWLGDLLSGLLSRFSGGPAPEGDPPAKNGCEMDPNGKPICPVVVGEPRRARRGGAAGPFVKTGCTMDPWGRPICPATAGEDSGRPTEHGLRLADRRR